MKYLKLTFLFFVICLSSHAQLAEREKMHFKEMMTFYNDYEEKAFEEVMAFYRYVEHSENEDISDKNQGFYGIMTNIVIGRILKQHNKYLRKSDIAKLQLGCHLFLIVNSVKDSDEIMFYQTPFKLLRYTLALERKGQVQIDGEVYTDNKALVEYWLDKYYYEVWGTLFVYFNFLELEGISEFNNSLIHDLHTSEKLKLATKKGFDLLK